MTKEEVINLLIQKKIIKKNNENDYSLVSTSKVTVACKNLPQKYNGLSAKQALETFFQDCEIPHIIENDNFKYSGRSTTKKSEKIFMEILKDDSIDFTTLVVRTKSWYKDPKSAKSKMSTYFESGQWRTIYEMQQSSSENNQFWR